MRFENADVARENRAANAIRDGALVALTFTRKSADSLSTIDLAFEKKAEDGVRTVRLQLRDVHAFDVSHDPHAPFEIAFCTSTWTDADGFYLSLDPWEEGVPSDRDKDCFRSRAVNMTIESK